MEGSTGVESSYLLRDLDYNERQFLFKCFREESCSAGNYVFKENDDGDTLYITESGIVSLASAMIPGAAETTLLMATPGELFGEVSFVDQRGRAASAIVRQEAVLKVLSRSDFDQCRSPCPADQAGHGPDPRGQ